MNKQELPEAVAAGRKAIEYCMVGVATRSRQMSIQDITELHGLTMLLRQYKQTMGRQILMQCQATSGKRSKGNAA
ncbi:MAG: hypothetical protein B7Y56_10810 [Gallionellales bacterium 35-53-114]|nr:MAG: hypothetical protein B7Y56_10810 [Gallionellales bacterium 35-53-114]OYZ64887.1 MAG: hypothetical protein B7Y04_03790 [Gallionellales bacterium 24-53-125]OZB07575.1 MAG: hypothetical protein B7X61_13225 [Gallionellales bacterium 39-52-133]